MSISSQLPQVILAARSGALQALALQAGQTLEGMVIGPAPNGGTQVQISGQMLNLVLPTLAKAGETLKFEVQGSGAQLRLALQPATVPSPAPAAPTVLPAPTQPATLPLPQVQGGTPAPVQPAAAPPPAALPVPAVPVAAAALPPSPPPVPVSAGAPPLPSTTPPAPSSPPAQPAVVVSQSTPLPSPMPAPSPAIGAPPLPAAIVPPPTSPLPPPAVQTQAQLYQPAAPAVPATPSQPAVTPAVAPAAVAPKPVPGPTPPAATGPAPTMPATPQAALTQMVQQALPSQAPVTGLTTALTAIAGKVILPEPVARAAQQVLAGRVNLSSGKIDAPALQRAIMTSGVFQEATLAGTPTPLTQPDMKASLLALRQTLTTWLGQQAPIAAATHVAPPLRGSVPRARGAEAPPIDAAAPPEEVGKQLLERTDSALSRLRLHQHASLPDAAAKAGGDWSMDLPVLIGNYQTILQLQIHRDQQGTAEEASERGWQMRFAINLPGMGEAGAQVSLRGTATGVMLWATERNTSEALEAEVVALREDLAAAGLKPGAVIVRHGEPPAPAPAPSGHVVDSRR